MADTGVSTSTDTRTTGAKVLIVDDRPDNLLALEASLDGLGVGIVRAGSGPEALKRLLVDDFAVILLDVQMPGMDGFETARMIKSRARSATTPIIFLTAISRELEHQLHGYSAGAVDYLAKPFEPEVLRSKVSVFVALHDQARLIDAQNRLLAEHLEERERAQNALSRHAAELLRSNAALERFASAVGSELLEPLHVVFGLLELVNERHAGGLDEEGRLLVERARSRSIDLAERITEYLAEATSSLEPLRCEPVELDSALGQARKELSARIEERGAIVTSDPLPCVMGDAWQLVQVFVHLLGNALMIGAALHPEVHVGLRRRRAEWVIAVTDNGPGISAEDQVQLLTLFDGRERSEAKGAGLALSRRVVERHGGSMWVESVEDRGTTVSFSLPVAS